MIRSESFLNALIAHRLSRLTGQESLSVQALLRWWWQGLVLCLPAQWQAKLNPPPVELLIEAVGSDLVFSERVGARHQQELVRYPIALLDNNALDVPAPQGREVVLQLTSAQILTQTLTLPVAAERNLRQVITYQLDRLTPFPADQIYFDARPLHYQPDQRSIQVRFAWVLRSELDALLARLRKQGVRPQRVTLAGDHSGIDVLPSDQRPRRHSAINRVQTGLLLAVILTLCAALIVPLWQQRQLVITLMPQVDSAQRQAEQVLILREQLDQAIVSSQFLAERRQARPPTINILRELTELLPDHTWVEQLDLRETRVEVRGESQDAGALLAQVENSPLFRGASFGAPITKDPRSNRDRFYLIIPFAQGEG